MELDDVKRQSNLLERIVFLTDRYAALQKDLTKKRRCVPVGSGVEGGLLGECSESIQDSYHKSY